MTTALEILDKVRKNYLRQEKTLHAHIIHNAMEQIKKHGRKQKATEEVRAKEDQPERPCLRDSGCEACTTGGQAASCDHAAWSDGQAGAR